MNRFYGVMSPLSAIAGFVLATNDPISGVPPLLGAILFHLWSKEDDEE